MARALKTAKSSTVDTGFNNPDGTSNAIPSGEASYGVVGGSTGTSGSQIVARVKIGANSEADGYIIRQKGRAKFLVTDGTNTGTCALANTSNSSLADDTMTVTITLADSSTVRLARLTNKWGIDFNGNSYLLDFDHASSGTVIKSGTPQNAINLALVNNS